MLNNRSEMLLRLLAAGKPLLSDGSWSTELRARGYSGELSELANLEQPALVTGLARAYCEAGARLLWTNTFGASPSRPEARNLDMEAINRAGARIAREAACGGRYVLGAIGVFHATPALAVATQANALAEGGVDALILETMTSVSVARVSIKAASDAAGLPVFCTFAITAHAPPFPTACGHPVAVALNAALEAGAAAVGVNCIEPSIALALVQHLRTAFPVAPLIIRPNAGRPGVELEHTEAARLLQACSAAGATVTGGCCGIGPEAIALVDRTLD